MHCNSTYSVLPLSLKQPLWLCTATLHIVYYPSHWNSHYYCALQLYLQCTTPVTETAIMTVHCNSTYSVLPQSLKQPLLLCTATLPTVYYPCHWNSHYDCALQLYIQCTTPVTETAIMTVHCNSTYSVLPQSLKQPLLLCTATQLLFVRAKIFCKNYSLLVTRAFSLSTNKPLFMISHRGLWDWKPGWGVKK